MKKTFNNNLIKIVKDRYVFIPKGNGSKGYILEFVEFIKTLKKDGNKLYFNTSCFNIIIDGNGYIMDIPEKKIYADILKNMSCNAILIPNKNRNKIKKEEFNNISSYLKKAFIKSKIKVIGDNVIIGTGAVCLFSFINSISKLPLNKMETGAMMVSSYLVASLYIGSTILFEIYDNKKSKDIKYIYQQSLGKNNDYNVILNIKRINKYLDSLSSSDKVDCYKKYIKQLYDDYVNDVKSLVSLSASIYYHTDSDLKNMNDYKLDLNELENLLKLEFGKSKKLNR